MKPLILLLCLFCLGCSHNHTVHCEEVLISEDLHGFEAKDCEWEIVYWWQKDFE